MLRCLELRAEMPAQQFPKSSGTGPEMTGGTLIDTAGIGTVNLAYGTWSAWMFSVYPVDSRRYLNNMVINLPHTILRQMTASTSPRRKVSYICSLWVFRISFEWRQVVLWCILMIFDVFWWCLIYFVQPPWWLHSISMYLFFSIYKMKILRS